jgi:hypothetical protein
MPSLYTTGEVSADTDVARIGGQPIAPANTTWPSCARCSGPLRFIAQHPMPGGKRVLAFLCENDAGMCDEWDPVSGANLVLVVAGGTALQPPPGSETRPITPVFGPAIGLGTTGDASVGLLGGEPAWIQNDETPECCDKPMDFVLQLDEHAHPQLNFCGGGSAYVFACRSCERGAYIMQQ